MLWFEGRQVEPQPCMDSDEYSHLPLRDQVKKYRELAVNAREEAENVTDRKVRDSYIIIAERWEDLAVDIERLPACGRDWEVD